ncbi:MAG: DUF1559 domain-containing protein [Planctomyces sp.]|nr:DUF1559 domain-containing protein [Planctomyces sp.]
MPTAPAGSRRNASPGQRSTRRSTDTAARRAAASSSQQHPGPRSRSQSSPFQNPPPSRVITKPPSGNGCRSSRSILFPESRVRMRDILDGTTNTVMVGERVHRNVQAPAQPHSGIRRPQQRLVGRLGQRFA